MEKTLKIEGTSLAHAITPPEDFAPTWRMLIQLSSSLYQSLNFSTLLNRVKEPFTNTRFSSFKAQSIGFELGIGRIFSSFTISFLSLKLTQTNGTRKFHRFGKQGYWQEHIYVPEDPRAESF